MGCVHSSAKKNPEIKDAENVGSANPDLAKDDENLNNKLDNAGTDKDGNDGNGDSKPQATQQRRRLSIGNIQSDEQAPSDDENEGGGGGGKNGEQPRKLTEQSVLDMIDSLNKVRNQGESGLNKANAPSGANMKRRVSIGSETDKELNKRHSFKKKDESRYGDTSLEREGELGIGHSCRKGLKPESPNQDSFCILINENEFAFYGVFDGHGARGHDVSNFIKDNLPKVVLESAISNSSSANGGKPDTSSFRGVNCEQVLKESFLKMQAMVESHNKRGLLNAQLSGATCTFVIRDFIKDRLIVAHVGDSRSVMVHRKPVVGGMLDESGGGGGGGGGGGAKDGGGAPKDVQVVDLTLDHKPDLPQERAYIEENGGRVVFDGFANHRVYVRNGTYPGLNMSRALGDVLGSNHAGINNAPDVVVYCLKTGKVLTPEDRKRIDEELDELNNNIGKNTSLSDIDVKNSGGGSDGAEGGLKSIPLTSDTVKKYYENIPTLPLLMPHLNDKTTRVQLMICSDGVWEFLSSNHARELISNFPKSKAKEASETLAKNAWDSWIREEGGLVVDDITALVVYI